MIVRSLTGFVDPGWPVEPERLDSLTTSLNQARQALQDANYEVQTLRLATPPPSEMGHPVPPQERAEFAQRLEAEAFVHGIDYAALGPVLPDEPKGFNVIPDILAATETVFTSAIIADPETGLSVAAARASADIISRLSTIQADGFANLRFAALANVGAGSPFVPAAYHRPGPPAFAVATEGADLAIDAFRDVPSLSRGRRRMISMIEAHAAAIEHLLTPISLQNELRFLGIDFSLAPYPDHLRSIGTALESLGLPAIGLPGSAAAIAYLADCLDRAEFTRTGFCGLMLPVLEDSTLASRAAAGQLTVTDLLLFSTLCGTGLDTVPLPGDVSTEAMTAVLLDLGAIALRHNKPLTARLMPIPGKAAGDDVHFEFPYFADSRVVAIEAEPLTGLLSGSGILDIEPHRS
jgi:uncharacterized protein (UPF0210 family)